MLQVPCCRFSTIYVYTDNTLKHIQKTINIFNDKMKNKCKPKQRNVFFFFYGGEEIGDDYDISMFSIYSYSTITTDIHYNCK